MKTAKEKAEYWLNDNVAGWTETQLRCLTVLLKEQDRDTRHACAEAVLQQSDSPVLEMIVRCHAACTNARAV